MCNTIFAIHVLLTELLLILTPRLGYFFLRHSVVIGSKTQD